MGHGFVRSINFLGINFQAAPAQAPKGTEVVHNQIWNDHAIAIRISRQGEDAQFNLYNRLQVWECRFSRLGSGTEQSAMKICCLKRPVDFSLVGGSRTKRNQIGAPS
jgi:hypothetical protein